MKYRFNPKSGASSKAKTGSRRRKGRLSFRLPKKASVLIALAIGVFIGINASSYLNESWHPSPLPESSINVCFTPGQNCTGLIIKAIYEAKTSIHVQAYSFTSPEIAQALIAAKKRGVDVRILMDRSQKNARHSQLGTLLKAEVSVLIDQAPGIAHNKVIILDKALVLTGSFNFSRSSQTRNAENLLLIKDQKLAKLYLENWYKREVFALSNKR